MVTNRVSHLEPSFAFTFTLQSVQAYTKVVRPTFTDADQLEASPAVGLASARFCRQWRTCTRLGSTVPCLLLASA